MNARHSRPARVRDSALLALILAFAAHAGQPLTPPHGDPVEFAPKAGVPMTWSIVRINAPDVVTATVVSVPRGSATNAEPPTIEVSVESVLLGNSQKGSTKVLWAPTPFWSDPHWTSGPEQALARAQQDWSRTAVEMPSVGARFILFGRLEAGLRGRFIAESRGRLPLTTELLAQARAACAAAAPHGPSGIP